MNGWWWNPAEPGRGFFVEYRDGAACVACCAYDRDGRPQWHTVGPVVPDAGHALAARSRCLQPPAGGRDEQSLPFRLAFGGDSGALLDWGGVRIPLVLQYQELRDPFGEDEGPLGGWWTQGAGEGRVDLVCEHVGKRAFAALLAAEGWSTLEAARGADGAYEGKWWRFEGGQALGAPHRAPRGRELGAGRLRRAADGALELSLPDGTERRFAPLRWSASAAPATGGKPGKLQASVSSPATSADHSGLVPIHVEIERKDAFGEESVRLVVTRRDTGDVLLDRPVRLTGRPRKIRLALNSHLLPNGPARLAVSVRRGEVEAWTGALTVRISNAEPLAGKVRASLVRSGAPLVIDGAIDSTHFDMRDPELTPWFDRPDALEHLESLRRRGQIGADEHAALGQFAREGYMVLPEPVEEPLLRRIDGELEDAVAARVQGYAYGSSQRIVNLHLRYPGVRALWRHPTVLRYLEHVFGVPARPCQTLTYIFGSQQAAHQDTIHLTPFPQGYMCGVWVALEDVQPDSGELEVFPGTQALPRVYMSDAGCPKVTDNDWGEFQEKVVERYRKMLAEGGYGKVTYRPRRGSVLVWHENLLHGGSVRVDLSRSRRSIVSHYFADGGIAFYDSTGLPGHMG